MAFTLTTAAQLPLASGTLPNCHQYLDHSAWPTPAIIDQGYKSQITEQAQNDCRWVARRYGVDIDDLLEWNPSLSINYNNCHFQPGYSYCVSRTNGSKNREQVAYDTATICLSKGALESAEVVDGTDPECECFGRVTGQEMVDNNRLTCSDLFARSGFSVENIVEYNSWISEADCDGSLYAGLAKDASRAVCVGRLNSPTQTEVVVSSTSAAPPICTFDPKKGEYVCPDPSLCHFDPRKGEYVCPGPAATERNQAEKVEENLELRLLK